GADTAAQRPRPLPLSAHQLSLHHVACHCALRRLWWQKCVNTCGCRSMSPVNARYQTQRLHILLVSIVAHIITAPSDLVYYLSNYIFHLLLSPTISPTHDD